MNEQILNNMANSIGIDLERLKAKSLSVREDQGAAWKNAGKSDEDIDILSMRVAARQINNEQASMRRSGAVWFEGMFVSVPRPKEWGKILYNKMKNQLVGADEGMKTALVEQGAVVIFENNHDGTYTRSSRDDFGGTSEVDSLPKHTMALDSNTHFYVVWDKNNPTFPSGDANFKFGRARPQDEKERVCLFFGRQEGDGGEWKPIRVSGNGKGADIQFPTFIPGRVSLRPARNGDSAYVKDGVTEFVADEDKSTLFPEPPIIYRDGQSALGLMPTYLPEDTLPSLAGLENYYNTYREQAGWYDRMLVVPTEVIHIDPRDKGGCVMICADLDMTSMADTVDVYVPASQENLVDFAVGTKVMLVGQTWRGNEGDMRLSVNGWWAFDQVESVGGMSMDNEEGWDA
tara:strand:- start:15443 stop:16648 length:1206 start_codon:yes stop_codon:yes gene_type:complete